VIVRLQTWEVEIQVQAAIKCHMEGALEVRGSGLLKNSNFF
jgi:hypothetical protein